MEGLEKLLPRWALVTLALVAAIVAPSVGVVSVVAEPDATREDRIYMLLVAMGSLATLVAGVGVCVFVSRQIIPLMQRVVRNANSKRTDIVDTGTSWPFVGLLVLLLGMLSVVNTMMMSEFFRWIVSDAPANESVAALYSAAMYALALVILGIMLAVAANVDNSSLGIRALWLAQGLVLILAETVGMYRIGETLELPSSMDLEPWITGAWLSGLGFILASGSLISAYYVGATIGRKVRATAESGAASA